MDQQALKSKLIANSRISCQRSSFKETFARDDSTAKNG